MTKMLLITGLILMLSVGVFAQEGRVVVDVTYTIDNVEYTKRLVTNYTEHASAFALAEAEFKEIERNHILLGEEYDDITSAGLVDEDGKVEVEFTYDNGRTYTITRFYDAKQDAYNKVAQRINYIKRESMILGEELDDLTVGEIMEVDGGFEAILSYNRGRTYKISEFYEPKAIAYHNVMTQAMAIKSAGIINGVDVGSVGEIMEVDGGFEVIVTDDNGKKIKVSDFFDPKAQAYHNVMVQLKEYKELATINGVAVDTVGEVMENAGRFEFTVTDDDGKKFAIHEFFDPKEKAVYEMNMEIARLLREESLNGEEITVVAVSDLQIF